VREFRKQGVSSRTVAARRFDLDELMVLERPGRLLQHRFGEAGIAEPDHGLEGMGDSAQVAALAIREAEWGRHA
jgi:hypothetical protein